MPLVTSSDEAGESCSTATRRARVFKLADKIIQEPRRLLVEDAHDIDAAIGAAVQCAGHRVSPIHEGEIDGRKSEPPKDRAGACAYFRILTVCPTDVAPQARIAIELAAGTSPLRTHCEHVQRSTPNAWTDELEPSRRQRLPAAPCRHLPERERIGDHERRLVGIGV